MPSDLVGDKNTPHELPTTLHGVKPRRLQSTWYDALVLQGLCPTMRSPDYYRQLARRKNLHHLPEKGVAVHGWGSWIALFGTDSVYTNTMRCASHSCHNHWKFVSIQHDDACKNVLMHVHRKTPTLKPMSTEPNNEWCVMHICSSDSLNISGTGATNTCYR
jgi:hypothetical protein